MHSWFIHVNRYDHYQYTQYDIGLMSETESSLQWRKSHVSIHAERVSSSILTRKDINNIESTTTEILNKKTYALRQIYSA